MGKLKSQPHIIEILKYIGSLVGVFVGCLLAHKNENDKIKYSELRQLKRSLYVLLEIINSLPGAYRIPGVDRDFKYEKIHLKKVYEKVLGNISSLYCIS